MHHILQKCDLWRLWSFHSISFVCCQFYYYHYYHHHHHHHHHHFFSKQFTSGFRISNFIGFRIPYRGGFWIPVRWIPDSNGKNFVDSGFCILLHGANFWWKKKPGNNVKISHNTPVSDKYEVDYVRLLLVIVIIAYDVAVAKKALCQCLSMSFQLRFNCCT